MAMQNKYGPLMQALQIEDKDEFVEIQQDDEIKQAAYIGKVKSMVTSYLNQNSQIAEDKISASMKFEGLKNQPVLRGKIESTFGDLKVKELDKIMKCECFSADLFKSYLRILSVLKEIASACQGVIQQSDIGDSEDKNTQIIQQTLKELKEQGQDDHILDKLKNILGEREHRMIVVDPPVIKVCEEKIPLLDIQEGDDES